MSLTSLIICATRKCMGAMVSQDQVAKMASWKFTNFLTFLLVFSLSFTRATSPFGKDTMKSMARSPVGEKSFEVLFSPGQPFWIYLLQVFFHGWYIFTWKCIFSWGSYFQANTGWGNALVSSGNKSSSNLVVKIYEAIFCHTSMKC